jgi:DNA polymerase-1
VVNFGLLYGQGAPSLVDYARTKYGVALTLEEAKVFGKKFFETYQGIKVWHDESRRIANYSLKEVRTPIGRRRLIPKGSTWWETFTTIVNTPIQGGCGDVTKLAVLLLREQLPADAFIVAVIHDEIIIEASTERAEEIEVQASKIMCEAFEHIFDKVPNPKEL